MQKQNFKYHVKDNKLWLNDREITTKGIAENGGHYFVLEDDNPTHWINFELQKGKQVKVFYKCPDEKEDLSPFEREGKENNFRYFKTYLQINPLDSIVSFRFSKDEEVEKKKDGKWGKK